MGDDKDNQEGIGFSGISSLLPDDPPDTTEPQSAPASHSEGARATAETPASRTARPAPSTSPAATSQPKQPTPRQRSGGGAVWAWIGGIAVVVFLVWATNQSETQPAGQPAYQPPVAQTNTSTKPSTSTQNDQANTSVANTPQPDVPVLQRPPAGSGNVFSVGEIRYCLVLKQWLEDAQPVVNTYSQDQVDRFNGLVNDYNSRCHDYRYQVSDLEQAQRDIAPYAKRFQTDSRQWIRYGEIPATNAQRPVAQPATSTMVRNAQRGLNALGYNVGSPDGLMGPKTRTAIIAFQRTAGLEPDGQVSGQLLASLSSAQSRADHSQGAVNGSRPTAVTPPPSASQLTFSEKSSIEVACASAVGAATHNQCLAQQLQQLANGPREPDMSGLTFDEKSSIDVACASAVGAANHNRCLTRQLQQLANGPREPDMSGLTFDEKSSIEVACASAVGAANHNQCLAQQLQQLANGPREPDMSGLTFDEKSSIDVACASAAGAANHNRCLARQLQQLANGPREPDMSGLTFDEKSSIEVACASAVGAANHNRCLIQQLRALGR